MPAAAKPKVAKKTVKKVAKLKRTDDRFTTLRKSITPGTIVILLAGRFRGRRVVVLKQLPKNGPLVVSGPFRYNGVPIRRVNPRYVIATSTRIDTAALDVSKITPELFKRAAVAKRQKGEKDFMGDKEKQAAEEKAKKTGKKTKSKGPNAGKVSDERYALQKSVDSGLIAALKKDALGKQKVGYLKSVFTILPGDAPHRMKF